MWEVNLGRQKILQLVSTNFGDSTFEITNFRKQLTCGTSMKWGVSVLNFSRSLATLAVTIDTGGEPLLPVCFVIRHFQREEELCVFT